ncbi:hypothetical protein BKA81DRAFT_162298 [Phyllosticta paracitricarpa]
MLCCVVVVVVVVDVRRLLLCHFIITYLSLVSSSFSGLRETPSFLPSLLPCRVLPPSDTAECHRPKSQPTHQPTNPPTHQPSNQPSIHPSIHPTSFVQYIWSAHQHHLQLADLPRSNSLRALPNYAGQSRPPNVSSPLPRLVQPLSPLRRQSPPLVSILKLEAA